jgi:hypothetical protein
MTEAGYLFKFYDENGKLLRKNELKLWVNSKILTLNDKNEGILIPFG